MPEQHLINRIRKLNEELALLDTQIRALQRKLVAINGENQSREHVEKVRKQIEDLKQKKEGFQKERSALQIQVKLQGTLEGKERKIEECEEKIKTYKTEIEELGRINKEEMEKLKDEIAELQRRITDLKSEIRELKQKIDERDNRMLLLAREMNENELNHKNRIRAMDAKHEEEMKELRYKTRVMFQKQQESHSKKIDEIRESNDFLEQDVRDLKKKMENDLNDRKKYVSNCSEENQHMLYLGQICSDLQTNWYRHVMPEDCHVENRTYKIKHIKDDILDSDIFECEEDQTQAKRRWKELQGKIDWKRNERLIKAIKRLQDERNRVAHPKDLNKERARSAAEKLRDQGKLKGKPSFNDVLMLIDLWESSKSL